MSLTNSTDLYSSLRPSVELFIKEFEKIPQERRTALKELAEFIQKRMSHAQTVYLNFICTHNSRRSHLAQIWAQTAAYYFGVSDVKCFSGGTEATAFNPRAVKAMQEAGFDIKKVKEGDNPVYEVRYANNQEPIIAFSKKYDDPFNRNKDFVAIMTCSHANENCPLVLGASARIAITYDDPKDYDGTSQEESKYQERVQEIGREIFYAFSQVNIEDENV